MSSEALRTEAESSVEIDVDPLSAFTIFTEEIDLWWVRGPINHYDSSRIVEMRLEPGVGGRVLEIYDEAAGELGRGEQVTVWEPGERLVLTGDVTEVDISFTKIDSGTRVTVRQYLLPGADPEQAGFGWVNMLPTYDAWLKRRDTASNTPRQIERLGIVLYYKDPVSAAGWLKEAFQLGDWDVDHALRPGALPGWTDLHVGDALVILLAASADDPPPSGHDVWVHVDDLESHFEHAAAAGAEIISPITSHGFTSYQAADPEGHRWTFVQAPPGMRSKSGS